MFRPNWKYLVVGAVVVASLMVGVSQAEACWSCYRPVSYWASACYTPCYTSCYTSCYSLSCCDPCGGTYYLGWRPGPVRRLLRGRYRWYYSPWSSCSYDRCWSGCGCDDSGTTQTPAQAEQKLKPTPAPAEGSPTPAPTPEPAPPQGAVEPPPPPPPGFPDSTAIPTRDNSGLLTIYVPFTAKVFINDHQTKTSGSRRRYVSHGLQPGLTYKYVIRAEIERDGKLVDETKTVHLTAGEMEGVAFGFNPTPVQGLASTQ